MCEENDLFKKSIYNIIVIHKKLGNNEIAANLIKNYLFKDL